MNTLLEEKIMHDIAEHLKSVMTNKKIAFSPDIDDAGTVLAYMNALGKRILRKQRKVVFSKELKCKIDGSEFLRNSQVLSVDEAQDITNLIIHFQNLFENGEDINNHLSTQIFSSKRQDILFNTWNIKHIHLNVDEAKSKSAMKKNRSDFLLFCVVEDEVVYFLDVRHHPNSAEFSSYSFLEIAFNNHWMRHLGFGETGAEYVPYSMEPKITNDKEIYDLYSHNINLAFDFQGHGFISVATGVTGSGDRKANVYHLNQLKKEIRKMPFSVEEYIGFFPVSQERASGLIKFSHSEKTSEYNFNLD